MPDSPLATLRRALAAGDIDPRAVALAGLAHANGNASRNTYLHLDRTALLAQADALPLRFPDPATRPPLYGVPVSLKDCFDLAGARTTRGSRFYQQLDPPAGHHSALARRLLDAGCLIPGKTHLHALAYGITGRNTGYGDCLQPRDGSLLTGGSSSGAAASVQEGSALAAIGTDTGGSIRVPAALCGLAGFRASQNLPTLWPDLWRGAYHLAPSFDTIGLLCRHPGDLAPLAHALFPIPPAVGPRSPTIGCVARSFLHDAAPEVLAARRAAGSWLQAAGASLVDFTPDWSDSLEIFAAIQAHEAAALHRGHFDRFDPDIAQRLHAGASLTAPGLALLRRRHAAFNAGLLRLFTEFDLLMLPCAPVSRLPSAADHATARQTILRYTTPFSLAGLPTAVLPGELLNPDDPALFGTGIQIAAPPGADSALLAFIAHAADRLPALLH